jgi:hypothetical protein
VKYLISLLIFFAFSGKCLAQVENDTVSVQSNAVEQSPVDTRADEIRKKRADSMAARIAVMLKRLNARATGQGINEKISASLRTHPYYNFYAQPRYMVNIRRKDIGKEGLFYLLTGIVLYYALVRLIFEKYMNNLFSVFFRVSLKQKQIREQLLQSPLPSLLLNIFFIITGGIYFSFILSYYGFRGTYNGWYLMLNCIIALALVYVVKYILLKIMGWIFNIVDATDTYAFVVFLVNKLLGIMLIPVLILLAFSEPSLVAVLVTLSVTGVFIMFGYRYVVSYSPIRKEIKVSQFHFLIYLCAFEIMPLLLIYKVLLTFFGKSS